MSTAGDRVQTTVRFRRGRYRAVGEISALLGVSREDAVNLLLGEGLAAMYPRLGIERDPAAAAAELLGLVAGQWEADLSDEELDAVKVTMAALARITEIRARETEDG